MNIEAPAQKINGQLTPDRFVDGGVAIAEPAVPATTPFGRNTHDRAFFETVIAVEWRKQVSAIVATGKWLLQAKEELNEHDFAALKLPFSARISQMLRQIASNPVLSDPAKFTSLPPCWFTLVLLSRLPDQRLRAMIADGRIHPELQQKEARALCGASSKGRRKGKGQDQEGNDQDIWSLDPVVIWSTFSPTDKEKILKSEGRTGLVKLAPDLVVDLVDHAIQQEIVFASTKLKPAVTFTAILRTALDPATADAGAVIARFSAKLKSLGLDLHDVSVAVRAKGQGKRREKR
jgi:hypothetical protein